jgi:hypothetical protein
LILFSQLWYKPLIKAFAPRSRRPTSMSQIFHRSANTLLNPNIEPQDFLEFDHADRPVHDRVDAEARQKEWSISAEAIGLVRD